MDLSRCHNGGMGSGIVLPRHPATPPSELLSKNVKKENGKNGSSSGSINPKTAFFSISNLVNGLRQQQEKGKLLKSSLAQAFLHTFWDIKNVTKIL
jgi:hypothetical protein